MAGGAAPAAGAESANARRTGSNPYLDLEECLSHPLFMEKLPDDISSNSTLMALSQLTEDGLKDPQAAFRNNLTLAKDFYQEAKRNASRLELVEKLCRDALVLECVPGGERAKAYNQLALVARQRRDHALALQYARAALRSDYTNKSAYGLMALSALSLNLYGEALKVAELGLKQHPGNESLEALAAQARPLYEAHCEAKQRVAQEAAQRALLLQRIWAQLEIAYSSEQPFGVAAPEPRVTDAGELGLSVLVVFERWSTVHLIETVTLATRVEDIRPLISQFALDHRASVAPQAWRLEAQTDGRSFAPLDGCAAVADVLRLVRLLQRCLVLRAHA